MVRRSAAAKSWCRQPGPKMDFRAVHPPRKSAIVVPFRRRLNPPARRPSIERPFIWSESSFSQSQAQSLPRVAADTGPRRTPVTADQISNALRKAGKARVRGQSVARRSLRRPTLTSGYYVYRYQPLAPAKKPRAAEIDAPLSLTDELLEDISRQVLAKFQSPRVRDCERVLHAALVFRDGVSRSRERDALQSHLIVELQSRCERTDPQLVTRRWMRSQGHRVLGELVQWMWELFRTARSIRDEPHIERRLRQLPRADVREACHGNVNLFFVVEERGSRSVTIVELLSERELATWLKSRRVPRRASR